MSAVGAVGPSPPPSLARLLNVLEASTVSPSFVEHSVRFGTSLEVGRLTAYHDVLRGTATGVGHVVAQFEELADSLAFPIHEPVREFLNVDVLRSLASLDQVALGIDARAAESLTRLKFYVVFGTSDGPNVAHMLSALGTRPMPALDPTQVRIVGFDLTPHGLGDVKVYMRLDRDRLRHAVGGLASCRELVVGAKEVVLQQCLIDTSRRQLHFHAEDARVYRRWLASTPDSGAAGVLHHADALSRMNGGPRVDPWIIGLPIVDGRVQTDRGNVYLHVDESGLTTAPRHA